MKINLISDINKDNYYILDYDRVDLYMVKTAWLSFVFLLFYSAALYWFAPAAAYPNPFSWRLVTLTEVFWTNVIGFLSACAITFFRGRFQNHYAYRFLVANGLVAYSYLVIFISGGSIEWHFHFFVMFALLALYADWRLGWWFVIAVALHHNILNFIAPGWVYFYGRNDLASLVHGLLVIFMTIVTTKICEQNRRLADASRLIGDEFGK